MAVFRRKQSTTAPVNDKRLEDFKYLPREMIYLDSACQSMRPQPVIDSLTTYYQTYNACGGRVKYRWGQQVDNDLIQTRKQVLHRLGHSGKNYAVAFTLNTTYGINLLLDQLPLRDFSTIITSDIEHNSVFLPTLRISQSRELRRVVLSRTPEGALIYSPDQLHNSIVVVNATSNIDGRGLINLAALIRDCHERGGIVILDGAQTLAHHANIVHNLPFDAICFSGHKLYGPSLGVVVARIDLLKRLEYRFIGGGMVSDVTSDTYTLTADDWSSRLEPGLQAFGEIIALGTALEWLEHQSNNQAQLHTLAEVLFEGLTNIPGIKPFNTNPSLVISFSSRLHDSHRLATFLSAQGIMARSGYFCCHNYLLHQLKLPPLVRLSLGLHNTVADIDRCLRVLKSLHK